MGEAAALLIFIVGLLARIWSTRFSYAARIVLGALLFHTLFVPKCTMTA
jgi:hypothetical protein